MALKADQTAFAGLNDKAESFTIDTIAQYISKTITGEMLNAEGFAKGREISLIPDYCNLIYEFPVNAVQVPESIFAKTAAEVAVLMDQLMELPDTLKKVSNFKDDFEKLLEA